MGKKNQKRESKFIDKLKNTYRLVILNDETFEERASYRLSRLNLYLLVSSLLVIFASIIVMMIVFTNLKTYIPGFANPETDRRAIELTEIVQKMEIELAMRDKYMTSLELLIEAKKDSIDFETLDPEDYSDTTFSISPSDEEIELTKEVDELQKFNVNSVHSFEDQHKTLSFLNFFPPVKGEISAPFDRNIGHYGIDIISSKNSAIKSVLDGVVIFEDYTANGGNTIAIQHDNNIVSFYKHNSKLLKKVGMFVKKGESIAIIGNTGEMTTGPHLHFELWFESNPIDPLDFIKF